MNNKFTIYYYVYVEYRWSREKCVPYHNTHFVYSILQSETFSLIDSAINEAELITSKSTITVLNPVVNKTETLTSCEFKRVQIHDAHDTFIMGANVINYDNSISVEWNTERPNRHILDYANEADGSRDKDKPLWFLSTNLTGGRVKGDQIEC